jgi:hypothetical protein
MDPGQWLFVSLNAVFFAIFLHPVAKGSDKESTSKMTGFPPHLDNGSIVCVASVAVDGYYVAPVAILPFPPNGFGAVHSEERIYFF